MLLGAPATEEEQRRRKKNKEVYTIIATLNSINRNPRRKKNKELILLFIETNNNGISRNPRRKKNKERRLMRIQYLSKILCPHCYFNGSGEVKRYLITICHTLDSFLVILSPHWEYNLPVALEGMIDLNYISNYSQISKLRSQTLKRVPTTHQIWHNFRKYNVRLVRENK